MSILLLDQKFHNALESGVIFANGLFDNARTGKAVNASVPAMFEILTAKLASFLWSGRSARRCTAKPRHRSTSAAAVGSCLPAAPAAAGTAAALCTISILGRATAELQLSTACTYLPCRRIITSTSAA